MFLSEWMVEQGLIIVARSEWGRNMNTEAFKTEVERHKEVMDTLIGDLKTQILNLPDNPNIKRAGIHIHLSFTIWETGHLNRLQKV